MRATHLHLPWHAHLCKGVYFKYHHGCGGTRSGILLLILLSIILGARVPGDHPSCVPGYPERYLVINIIKYLGATTLSGELQATNFLGTTRSDSGDTELVQWYPVVDR